MSIRIKTKTRQVLVAALAIITVVSLTGSAVAEESAGKFENMVYLNGGSFSMGFEGGHDDEVPLHEVTLKPFYIDSREVTNRQFGEFVKATGYKTQAEYDSYCWAYLEGADNFKRIDGADWRHPEGPESSIEDRLDHPVVCVNWYDASAYAKWAGKRLPTEAEWEYAARAGEDKQFVAAHDMNSQDDMKDMEGGMTHFAMAENKAQHAGQDQSPSSKSHNLAASGNQHTMTMSGETLVEANIWQGGWPHVNKRSDGYFYTAPVGSYEPNDWEIHDMIGNVWEWTSDWYDEKYYSNSPADNPAGPQEGSKRVARGGSWFCNPTYCGAYSSHYRGASPPDRGFNNVGFRCALDAPEEN
jgi:formylglycine-generating enzyme required for sulfatase activity